MGLIFAALFTHRPSLAASSSDLLIVLNKDGRHYIAQHTLSTDKELLLLKLPETRDALSTRFLGPEQLIFSTAHARNPHTLSLWSGNVISRYRHSYSIDLESLEGSILELSIADAHYAVDSEDSTTLHSTITWVLPSDAKLISYGQTNVVEDIDGHWQHDENVLSYSQNGGAIPNLLVQFSLIVPKPAVTIDPCTAVIGPSDECSPDIDKDEIPDYRDICLPDTAEPILSERPGEDVLGCDSQPLVILKDINFEVGKSYLNVASRQVLDRAAIALQRTPNLLFEIAAHTDNAGSDSNNQKLSDKRAAAVRHYLMLRGVGPNQIKAVGYGERFPIASNRLRKGRGDNRRIELKRLN
ncbi:MAG: OmpA family protein [Granulosicoccus sp.]